MKIDLWKIYNKLEEIDRRYSYLNSTIDLSIFVILLFAIVFNLRFIKFILLPILLIKLFITTFMLIMLLIKMRKK